MSERSCPGAPPAPAAPGTADIVTHTQHVDVHILCPTSVRPRAPQRPSWIIANGGCRRAQGQAPTLADVTTAPMEDEDGARVLATYRRQEMVINVAVASDDAAYQATLTQEELRIKKNALRTYLENHECVRPSSAHEPCSCSSRCCAWNSCEPSPTRGPSQVNGNRGIRSNGARTGQSRTGQEGSGARGSGLDAIATVAMAAYAMPERSSEPRADLPDAASVSGPCAQLSIACTCLHVSRTQAARFGSRPTAAQTCSRVSSHTWRWA